MIYNILVRRNDDTLLDDPIPGVGTYNPDILRLLKNAPRATISKAERFPTIGKKIHLSRNM